MQFTHTICPGCRHLANLEAELCVICGTILVTAEPPIIQPKLFLVKKSPRTQEVRCNDYLRA